MARQAITKTLSLRPDEAKRFERLVRRFGRGSTSEFVRAAMDRLETAEVAEELADLRRYGRRRANVLGVADVDVRDAVRKTLNR
jgi:Arc/MetJ-type ribon-helix-helix transcriptional regulator